MPYCTQCGTFVLDGDRFCPRCGKPQTAGVTPPPRAAGGASGAARPEPPPGGAAAGPSPPGEAGSGPSPAAGAAPPGAAGAGGALPPPPPPPRGPVRPTIAPNKAALLCYIPGLGWIASVIFLALDPYRDNRYVRFHAFQGLYLAVLWLLTKVFFFPFPMGPMHDFPFHGLRGVLQLLVIIAQVAGIIKTAQNQEYRIPIISELAEKSLA